MYYCTNSFKFDGILVSDLFLLKEKAEKVNNKETAFSI